MQVYVYARTSSITELEVDNVHQHEFCKQCMTIMWLAEHVASESAFSCMWSLPDNLLYTLLLWICVCGLTIPYMYNVLIIMPDVLIITLMNIIDFILIWYYTSLDPEFQLKKLKYGTSATCARIDSSEEKYLSKIFNGLYY